MIAIVILPNEKGNANLVIEINIGIVSNSIRKRDYVVFDAFEKS